MTYKYTREGSRTHTHKYSNNTITRLLMSCLHTKYWNSKLIHTVFGFLVWVTNVCVNEMGSFFHSDTSLVVSAMMMHSMSHLLKHLGHFSHLKAIRGYSVSVSLVPAPKSGGTIVNPTKTFSPRLNVTHSSWITHSWQPENTNRQLGGIKSVRRMILCVF